MQFTNKLAGAALVLASLASATNLVTFVNQDNTTRNIVFTAEADLGLAAIPNLVIEGMATANQTLPDGFIGNAYSYNNGSENVPGMLAEFRFGGFDDLTFFDVSSIVNATDTEGVKLIVPAGMNMTSAETPVSGCMRSTTLCANQYNAPDDIATKATSATHLMVYLGNAVSKRSSRRSAAEVYPRSFVLGAEPSQ